jgi:DNA-binding MarR family transcriptional regulator
MEEHNHFLEVCLFFSANALVRSLLKLAEKEFNHLELSPAHASLLLVIYDSPGITPKELSQILKLSPSTITRFLDSLEKKKLLQRKIKGKSAFISPTDKGIEIKPAIAKAYQHFFNAYNEILGYIPTGQLCLDILDANRKLNEHLK